MGRGASGPEQLPRTPYSDGPCKRGFNAQRAPSRKFLTLLSLPLCFVNRVHRTMEMY